MTHPEKKIGVRFLYITLLHQPRNGMDELIAQRRATFCRFTSRLAVAVTLAETYPFDRA